MLISESQTTEDLIVEILAYKSHAGPELLIKINLRLNKTYTKQALYHILRKLIKSEIVHKSLGLYELNQVWRERVVGLLNPQQDKGSALFKNLEDGDRISLKFKNPASLNAYWAHSFSYIFEEYDMELGPILIYHPHEWLIHSRPQQERFFLGRFIKSKKMCWFTIGGNTQLDKDFSKENKSKYIKVNKGIEYSFSNTQYVNVVGDYVFTIKVSGGFADKLDHLYQEYDAASSAFTDRLAEISQEKYKTIFVLERNEKKAGKIRKQFKRDFF